jgi:hypothetical protein
MPVEDHITDQRSFARTMKSMEKPAVVTRSDFAKANNKHETFFLELECYNQFCHSSNLFAGDVCGRNPQNCNSNISACDVDGPIPNKPIVRVNFARDHNLYSTKSCATNERGLFGKYLESYGLMVMSDHDAQRIKCLGFSNDVSWISVDFFVSMQEQTCTLEIIISH